jgi:hypothetical protein
MRRYHMEAFWYWAELSDIPSFVASIWLGSHNITYVIVNVCSFVRS